MKPFILATALLTVAGSGLAKKVLDHSSFDDWKLVSNHSVSRDGSWGAYSVNPQQGDGILTFYNSKNGKKIEIPRGYKPSFTADSRWAIASIKPFYADTRKAKIDKKKDFDMPQDSLAIVDLVKGKVVRIPNVISYRIGEDGVDWLAYLSCDTNYIKPKALKDKKAGKPLVVRHLPSGNSKVINWTKDYAVSRLGDKVAVSLKHHSSDSTATDGLGFISLPDTAFLLLDRERKNYGKPVFDRAGNRLAFTVSNDTNDTGTKIYDLMVADLRVSHPEPEQFVLRHYPSGRINLSRPHAADSVKQKELMDRWYEANARQEFEALKPNQYSTPEFSYDGRRIVIGMAPSIAPNDTTIVDFEQPEVDIWRWDAPYTPPQENKNLDKTKKKTFPAVLNLETGDYTTIYSNPLEKVDAPSRWDADWALVHDPSKDIISQQWDYTAPEQIYIVNVNDGTKKEIGEVSIDNAELSPDGKYVIWFEGRDYYIYDIAAGETRNISSGVPAIFWDDHDDHPMKPQPIGLAGWEKGDNRVIVYDRWDLWSLDPKGVSAPYSLTAGNGKKNNRKYRYVKTDPEHRFFTPGEEILLSAFDYADKRNGLETLVYGKAAVPKERILDGYSFTQIRRAKDKPVYSFIKSNFSTSPDVYVSVGPEFGKATRLSDANPQMKEYNWGTAQLVQWHAYNGDLTDGVLYVPEDLDPTKKYPMLCVFYETGSEDLYTHYVMQPSWSWVNYPFYVSRGYVVFVPDIHYTAGVPGECAYNYVCSGAEEMCKRFPWIDKDRIGIDGQSWGGYQTAYLVTRTNMFACAGSGAPVANMTSAFGGIRWESGSSRQAQYEMGQSRIGRNLWESPELYIANSPVFHADRVETPLLIMHNDADGAVPWYQGIEMFMALRRLNKPVWMLQYNGEAHNLRERKNRKDITVRLQQFFDHYLKGDPMPEWMKNGIPATRKGQYLGY